MKRAVLATVLAISALSAVAAVAVPGTAFAHERSEARQAEWAKKFPMPAAEFKQHSEARMSKMRARLDSRLEKVPADKAKEIRAKVAEGEAKVRAEIEKVTADGTVTLEEAKGVKQLARSLHPHRGEGGKRGGGEKK